MRKIIAISLTVGLIVGASVSLNAQQKSQGTGIDSLDTFVRKQMARRHIPGLSLAIVEDGRIVVARGYGVVDETSRTPVTPSTLFQAGSISKPVSALGALHLVEGGRLSLDGDVNAKLTSWKVPDNNFTAMAKVTLRRILSHSAGLTVHGFPGYDVTEPLPSLVQVLDGAPPTNTAPIRVDTIPGAISRYSGGGYTLMQQMLIDVTGLPFPRFMQETVLGPIGMSSSSFEQPQPPERTVLTASGYYLDRRPVRGRWHVYPEMAAAGLWTTATDLAKFAIEIQQTLAGRGQGVISQEMARQYLTEQKGDFGLGILVSGTGSALSFRHNGRDEGFDAQLVAFAHTGQGAAFMINANDNSRFGGRLLDFIGRMYNWPQNGSAPREPAAVRGVQLITSRLARYAGYYEFRENQMITLVPNQDGNGIETLVDDLPDETFLPIDSARFVSSDRGMRINFAVDSRNATIGVVWRVGETPGDRLVPRLAPLPSTLSPAPDPDPALTSRIREALHAIRQQGSALQDSRDIPSGTKKDFAGYGGRELDGLRALIWLDEERVSDRGIHRHGSDVQRVVFYKVTTNNGQRYLLVHLTAQGTVADFDVVKL